MSQLPIVLIRQPGQHPDGDFKTELMGPAAWRIVRGSSMLARWSPTLQRALDARSIHVFNDVQRGVQRFRAPGCARAPSLTNVGGHGMLACGASSTSLPQPGLNWYTM